MTVTKKTTKVLTKVIAILVLVAFQHASGQAPDLYSEADDVIRLNATTFIPTVFHKNDNTTFVVQFYNTFCGHCQSFAPIYKELATGIKNWTSVVKIAGIDCSKDENTLTCSDNQIAGYPTILIFPPNPRPGNPSDKPLDLRSLKIEWTIDDIEESIIQYVSKLKETRNPIPMISLALEPIQASSLQSLKRIYPLDDEVAEGESDIKDLMIIVESENSYLGRKLIMEFFRINKKLELRRVLTSNLQFLKSALSKEHLAKLNADQPLLIRVTSQSNEDNHSEKAQVLVKGQLSTVSPTSSDRERQDFLLEKFKQFFQHFFSIELKDVDGQKFESHFPIRPPKKISAENQHQQDLDLKHILQKESIGRNRIFSIDLLKGIVYMFSHEVAIKGNLTPDEVTTIRNLLTILKKYLPLEKWDPLVHKFLEDLRTRLDDNRFIYEEKGITAQEMRDLLDLAGADQVKSKYKKESWLSCLESDKQHKGYTCSLWLLFHTLTVGEFTKAAPVQVKPALVLKTMRDYIIRFLGCTVCSINFEKETESLEESILHRNSSVVWLWRTHNRVSQRLNNEKQENRKALSEVIFPSAKRCPYCYLDASNSVDSNGKTLDDIQWNMNNVPSYLVDLYRPDRVISPNELANLMIDAQDKLNYILDNNNPIADSSHTEQATGQGIFSTGDMSICLFLYFSCIVIVVLVCLALNPKWKRCKTK